MYSHFKSNQQSLGIDSYFAELLNYRTFEKGQETKGYLVLSFLLMVGSIIVQRLSSFNSFVVYINIDAQIILLFELRLPRWRGTGHAMGILDRRITITRYKRRIQRSSSHIKIG